MPCTPIADKASRTSSSLNGLMIAVTSFMVSLRSERVRHEADEARLAPVLALDGVEIVVRVGALEIGARVEAAAEVPRRATLPHGVRELAVVGIPLVAEDAIQRELLERGQRIVDRELEVVR